MNKLIVIVVISFLFTSICACQTNTKNDENSVDRNQPIDTGIVNQIITHYIQEHKNDSMSKEVTDTNITLSFWFKEDSEFSYNGNAVISKMQKDFLRGDLDGDKLDEIVCNIGCESGGTAWDNDIFIFKKNDAKYTILLFQATNDLCGCDYQSSSQYFVPKKISNGMIVGESVCWTENDGHCCPSLIYSTNVLFTKGKLSFAYKKLIRTSKQNTNDEKNIEIDSNTSIKDLR